MSSPLTTPTTNLMVKPSLMELSWGVFKVGAIAFGGHAALVVMVERYLVTKKKVFSSDDILNAMSLATLLPGPLAVNVVCYLGYRLRGWLGAGVFLVAITAPPTILMMVLAAWYYRLGTRSGDVKPTVFVLLAVAALVVSTGYTLYKKQIGNDVTGVLLCVTALMTTLWYQGFAGTVFLILIGAIVGYLTYKKENTDIGSPRPRRPYRSVSHIGMGSLLLVVLVGYVMGGYRYVPHGPLQLLSVFGGMSLTLFGGGMVIIPYMQAVLVDDLGWLPLQEYVDAIAFGQITPGPILVSVTFIGYKIAGALGAVMATGAIFIPSAALMILLAQYINHQHKSMKAVFRGIRPVVIGMILAAGIQLVMVVPQFSWFALLFGVAGWLALTFARLNPIYLILLGFFIDYIS